MFMAEITQVCQLSHPNATQSMQKANHNHVEPHNKRHHDKAFTLARLFRTSTRTCFFNLMTLNRSKSVRALRFPLRSRALAKAVSLQVFSKPDSFSLAAKVPGLMPRGISTVSFVRATSERRTAWRGTPLPFSVDGPSTSTRPESMISIMTATWFSYGLPFEKRTTRPTWTSGHLLGVTSTSAMSTDCVIYCPKTVTASIRADSVSRRQCEAERLSIVGDYYGVRHGCG